MTLTAVTSLESLFSSSSASFWLSDLSVCVRKRAKFRRSTKHYSSRPAGIIPNNALSPCLQCGQMCNITKNDRLNITASNRINSGFQPAPRRIPQILDVDLQSLNKTTQGPTLRESTLSRVKPSIIILIRFSLFFLSTTLSHSITKGRQETFFTFTSGNVPMRLNTRFHAVHDDITATQAPWQRV